jgi:hypothetical protein
MALSAEPNSGLVTADNWCSTQLIGDAPDESIQSQRKPLLASEHPALTRA